MKKDKIKSKKLVIGTGCAKIFVTLRARKKIIT